jgi:hypothetical protein
MSLLLLRPLDAGSVTGTADVTAEAATVEATGKETLSGTAGVIYVYEDGELVLQGTEPVSFAEVGAITAASATADATGAEAFRGTAAVTAEQATVAAEGEQVEPDESVTGTADVTAQQATVEATGAESFTGSADLTADAATVEAEGTHTAPAITGTASLEARQATTTGEGIVLADITGEAAVSAREASVTAIGIGGIVTEELPNLQAGSLSKRKPRPILISGHGTATAQPAEVLAFGTVNDDELVLMLLVA